MKFHWWQTVTAGVLIVAIGGITVYAGITARIKPSTTTQSQVTAQVYTSPKDAALTEIAQAQNLPTADPKPEVQKPEVQKPVIQKPVIQKPVTQKPVNQTVVPTPAPIPKEVIQEPKRTIVKPPVQAASRVCQLITVIERWLMIGGPRPLATGPMVRWQL